MGDVLLYRMKNATAKWIATQNEAEAKSPSDVYDQKTTAASEDTTAAAAALRASKSRGETTEKRVTSGEEERSSAILSQATFDVLTRTKPEVKKKWISEEAKRVRKERVPQHHLW